MIGRLIAEATECDFKVAVDRDAYESSANFRAGMEPFFLFRRYTIYGYVA